MRQPEGLAKGLHTGNMGGSSTRIVLGVGPRGIEWFGKMSSPFVNFLGLMRMCAFPKKGPRTKTHSSYSVGGEFLGLEEGKEI